MHDARRRMWLRTVLAMAMCAVLAGCNIFDWTHDEGSSDDPETLLQDAEDALLDRDYARALQAAEKGIAQDPPPMRFPRLRYVATQAVLGQSGVSISSYLTAFTSRNAPAKASPLRPAAPYDLLNISEAELRAIATACPRAIEFLAQILDALQRGEITPADLAGIQFDVDLGFGIANLLVAFVTVLDADQNLANGFVLDPRVRILADDTGGYTLQFSGPDSDAYITCTLFCPQRPLFCGALEGLWDAYRDAKGLGVPADIGCGGTGPSALPVTVDTSFLIGEVLQFVHTGLVDLFGTWSPGCASCPAPAKGVLP